MPNNMEKFFSRVRSTSKMMATVSRPMSVVGTSIWFRWSSVSMAFTTLLL